MKTRSGSLLSLMLAAFVLSLPVRAASPVVEILADPSAVRLQGPLAAYSLLVHGKTAGGNLVDLTRDAHFRSADSRIAGVGEDGVVRAVRDGATTISIEAAGKALSVPVTVTGAGEARRFNFENDIVPLLSRFGCNSSATARGSRR